ncbi:UNVERIFIED_ORG: hypothetical protein BCL66_110147 [Martelella mediterranea]
MANKARNTPASANEDACARGASPITRLFPKLLENMSAVVKTESAIEGKPVFDPAFAAWLHDAETAGDTLSDTVREMIALPATHPSDEMPQKLAFILDGLMGAETMAERHAARGNALRYAGELVFPGPHRAASDMVLARHGQDALSRLLQLELYRLQPDSLQDSSDFPEQPTLN